MQQLAVFAASVGVEKEMFQIVVEDFNTIQHIKWYQRLGRQNGVHGTPGFMVNGILTSEPQSGWDFDQWSKFLSKIK